MRYTASEKMEIIRTVEQSHLPLKRTLEHIGIPRSTWYNWYDRYLDNGFDGLEDKKPCPRSVWNRISDRTRHQVLELALDEPDLSPREVAVRYTEERQDFISESSVYRILKAEGLITSPAFMVMKAADQFHTKTTRVHELWQTDFTYLKVIGWGWFYLSTILDDYSRYVVAWKLCSTMTSKDAEDTLALALERTGLDKADISHRPRLLSDNGPSYVSTGFAEWLEEHGIEHTRGAPFHPQTQGKIERWHQSLKNRILLENYYLPGELKSKIADFIHHYNTRRYHESLNNLTPEDVYLGRGDRILEKRKQIKLKSLARRKSLHKKLMAA